LALEAFIDAIPEATSRTAPHIERRLPTPPNSPLTAMEVFAALSELRPKDAILVQGTPSNVSDLLQWWPTLWPDSYYTLASGGLGGNTPAAVGIAIAQKKSGSGRPAIAVIGDGSLQYSVQSLYTAAQHKLKLIYIVPWCDEYAIKEFAVLEKTPNVPALDLPGLDIVTTAKAFGCFGVAASTIEEIKQVFKAALGADGQL
jgi:benzoylformate decarboxylase